MGKARKTKIIKDKKERGEWAESVFVARASEQGLPVSKPWGDSRSFDCVVGRPGKFVAVQVKCTVAKVESGRGYICSTCSSHKVYRAGAFDFLAAYVIPEDAWYIIPAKEIRGQRSISLFTAESGEAKYEKYREAWELLREATDSKESKVEVDASAGYSHPSNTTKSGPPELVEAPKFPTKALERVKASMDFARRRMGMEEGEEND
jgi:PD-(D/E)XK endonuclease